MNVNVIGLGLIGGSIARDLRALDVCVYGSDSSKEVERTAHARGYVDDIGCDADADITVIAAPVDSLPSLVAESLEATRGVVTDCGSVKGAVCNAVSHDRFVGGHPMAGSDQGGIDAAQLGLFRGATWVLCSGSSASRAKVAEVVELLGARPLALDPVEHDAAVAAISHTPHVVACALMHVLVGNAQTAPLGRQLAAGGFRDVTRVAGSNPSLWRGILRENAAALRQALVALDDQLDLVREILDDDTRLEGWLDEASAARQTLPIRETTTPMSQLLVPIPDQPGAIGSVMAALLLINIEHVEVVHDARGDRGELVVTIATQDVAQARDALTQLDLSIVVRSVSGA